MAEPTGLAAQLGIKAESVWGTPVVVDTFVPLVSESLETSPENRIESAAIIAGRHVLTSEQWVVGNKEVGGDLGLELPTNSAIARVLLEHMLGSVSGSGPWTFTPGTLAGKGMTVQVGVPGADGTVRPKTFPGSKVASWEIAWTAGEIVTLGLTLISKDEYRHRTVTDGVTTNLDNTVTSATAAFTVGDIGQPIAGTGIPAGATIASINSATSVEISDAATASATGLTFTFGAALASASYASGAAIPFHAAGATATIAGTAVCVRQGTLAGDNMLDRQYCSGTRLTDEPQQIDLRSYTGSLDLEFEDRTQYDRFLNGTEAAVVLTFAGPGTTRLVLTYNARFDGETPKVGGRGRVAQPLGIKAIASTTDASAITAVFTA
jgi:hypothetical protein